MKKQFIVGMMIVTSAFTMNAHAAGGTKEVGGKTVRELFLDYVKQIKEYAFSGKSSAKDLNAQQAKAAQEKILKDMNASVQEKDSINLLITSSPDKKTEIIDSLASIAAAKKMSAGKSDAESKSIAQAADAGMALYAISPLVGYTKKSAFLTEGEMTEVSAGLIKWASLPDKFISFSSKERDSHSSLALKLEKIVNERPESVEEAFVKLIMKEYNLTKEQAIAKVKQLKDCV